jgi:hypothetical protein
MKSKIMIVVLSALTFMSLSACGKDCPPNRTKPPTPPVHYDGWATLTYADVDTGIQKDVKVGLTKTQNDYMGADVVSLPASLPNEVSVQVNLPQTTAEHSWDYVTMIAVDQQEPVRALYGSSSLTSGVDGMVYSASLIHVRETFPKDAVTGTFRIEMVSDEATETFHSIQVRFQKPSSL